MSQHPISISTGRLAKFPPDDPVDMEFDVSFVEDNLKLVVAGGRFVLKRRGLILKPYRSPRKVQVYTGKKHRSFNVANLLAFSIIGTPLDSNYRPWISDDGILMESDADRQKVISTLRHRLLGCPRTDITKVREYDFTGRGYYIDQGKIYRKNGKEIPIRRSSGTVAITDTLGKCRHVRIGHVAFWTLPNVYNFSSQWHTEQDHINGDHTDNRLENLRPVTITQNRMVCVREGKFRYPDRQICSQYQNVYADAELQQYETSSYYCHHKGVIFRKIKPEVYRPVRVRIDRHGYPSIGSKKCHQMMIQAFGVTCPPDADQIMHLDDNKQNFALRNLKWGNKYSNAHTKHPICITFVDGKGLEINQTTYETINAASRGSAIPYATIRCNLIRQTLENLSISKTGDGRYFYAVRIH